MTLGKKLSSYRTIRGLTQGQLGEKLNVSAQAVSKWENDLATPDIVTLKKLSVLYHVTLDELVDLKSGFQVHDDAEGVHENAERQNPIGFCMKCGVTVTNENFGERTPVILCSKCVAAREQAAKRDLYAMKERSKANDMYDRINAERERTVIKGRRTKSLIWAAVITAPVLFICILAIFSEEFSSDTLIGALILTYTTFAFTSSMFFDGVVRNLVLSMCAKSINWPGLIFTFDLDGFLWLIGMKLLFAALGFLIGIFFAILGLLLGILISPFTYPFTLLKISHDIRLGNASNYI